MGKPFVINRHGRLVFPSSFLADFDFTAIETEEQLSAVVRRDFEAKAPTAVVSAVATVADLAEKRRRVMRCLS